MALSSGRGVTANMLGLGPSDSGFESRRPDTYTRDCAVAFATRYTKRRMHKKRNARIVQQLLAIASLIVLIWVMNALHANWKLRQAAQAQEAQTVEGGVFEVGGQGTVEGAFDSGDLLPIE